MLAPRVRRRRLPPLRLAGLRPVRRRQVADRRRLRGGLRALRGNGGRAVIAALFIPAPWPGLILMLVALTFVAVCVVEVLRDGNR